MDIRTQERITYWLGQWNGQLEHPDEILLAPSLTNLLDHCYQELQKSKSKKPDIDLTGSGWPSQVLTLLQARLSSTSDKALPLLRAAYPIEMGALKTHLSSTKVPRQPTLQALQVCREPPALSLYIKLRLSPLNGGTRWTVQPPDGGRGRKGYALLAARPFEKD